MQLTCMYQTRKESKKNMQNIKIKYFTDKIEKLKYVDGKSDWIDMRASEEVTLHAGEFALIPLGVAIKKGKALYYI